MNLKFKNRIAFFNTLAAAASTFVVFAAVYLVVYLTAYKHLDDDIRKEHAAIFKEIVVQGEFIFLKHSPEWEEKEHEQVEINPTFVQITDHRGVPVFSSANLKNTHLKYFSGLAKPYFFDHLFNKERIRLGQFPIQNQTGAIVGQLSIGVSQAESASVLQNLRLVLLVAFPLLTFIFYWASSFAAARGIAPIHQLIKTAGEIDEKYMALRLPLPDRKDEIHQLATTINELLSRIEDSLKREKQITADISHELRTPLTGIRGTLEVLLRKDRTPEQYAQKLETVVLETDRMNKMLEQLLQVSRIEAGMVRPNMEPVALNPFLGQILEKWRPVLDEKNTTVHPDIPVGKVLLTDGGLLELIISNLLSNALKYGGPQNVITITWDESSHTLVVSDRGPGIAEAHLPYIFDRFYRTDDSRNNKIQGTGLGLFISKKLAGLLDIQLTAKSPGPGEGTTFLLQFG